MTHTKEICEKNVLQSLNLSNSSCEIWWLVWLHHKLKKNPTISMCQIQENSKH